MKHILYILFVVIGLMTVVAHAAGDFAGVSYQVEVTSVDSPAIVDGCMVFAEDGRFTMSGDTLTMAWMTEVHDARAFMAVTAAGEHSVVPYQVGVFGSLDGRGPLTGAGMDQFGNTFTFAGHAVDDCGVAGPETRPVELSVSGDLFAAAQPWKPRASRSAPADVTSARDMLLAALFAPVLDPCWSPAGWALPCDPPLNPLGSPKRNDAAQGKTDGQLQGRSFRLTLGSGGSGLREYCWQFDARGKVIGDGRTKLHWSPDTGTAERGAFQLVGSGNDGRGMAYHGALVGLNLVQVVGIEAHGDKTTALYGYGRAVDRCGNR